MNCGGNSKKGVSRKGVSRKGVSRKTFPEKAFHRKSLFSSHVPDSSRANVLNAFSATPFLKHFLETFFLKRPFLKPVPEGLS
jgi:hypothetical protein